MPAAGNGPQPLLRRWSTLARASFTLPAEKRWAVALDTITVLLVEDDEGDAILVGELLADVAKPFALTHARSLAGAEQLIGASDCVLLDLGLPDAMGLDALRRLRACAGRVPVVVLTGDSNERLGIEAVAAGAQDYLVKGQVSGPLLARTIRYAVQRRHVEEIESALLEERLHTQENIRLERGLLPRPLIQTPDLSLMSRYRPGGGRMLLGGDFYDAVQDNDGTLNMIIGDVAGHGPDQAALGVALRIAWRALVLAGLPPTEVFTIMDRLLVHERHDDALFATVCAVNVAPDRRTGSICVAGHPAPLVCGDAGWAPLDHAHGPALGILDVAQWAPTEVEFPPAPWQILLYTDGAVEGHDYRDADRLGVEGLRHLLNHDPRRSRIDGAMLDALIVAITELNRGPLTDDLALLLLTVEAGG